MDTLSFDKSFAEDVLRGLQASPKRLMSRYFYDAEGDRLFQEIMAMPEYYLADCEREILARHGPDLAGELAGDQPFDLVELGSGDGSKMSYLLDALHAAGMRFTFCPVDISDNSLQLLEDHLCGDRPWLDLQGVHANYMDLLDGMEPGEHARAFAFMGSNLGNFGDEQAVAFLRRVRGAMAERDCLLIGLDLKKDPDVILAAYNDPAGITRDFNLNLLHRINRELGGDFDPNGFEHRPEYDAESGAARSFLVSSRDQAVRIEALGRTFRFEAGEKVFMEVSQKYDQAMIDDMAQRAGFRVERAFRDRRGWFTDQLWRPLPAGA